MSVPSGEPDRTACPRCGALSGGGMPSDAGGAARALPRPPYSSSSPPPCSRCCAGGSLTQAGVLAFGFLGALGVALSAIDIAVHRLPDKLTLPAYPVMVVLLGAAAAIGHDGGTLLRALFGGGALAAGYLLLAVVRPGQLAGGDFQARGADRARARLAARRISLRSVICFGPFMLGGALLAIVAGGL